MARAVIARLDRCIDLVRICIEAAEGCDALICITVHQIVQLLTALIIILDKVGIIPQQSQRFVKQLPVAVALELTLIDRKLGHIVAIGIPMKQCTGGNIFIAVTKVEGRDVTVHREQIIARFTHTGQIGQTKVRAQNAHQCVNIDRRKLCTKAVICGSLGISSERCVKFECSLNGCNSFCQKRTAFIGIILIDRRSCNRKTRHAPLIPVIGVIVRSFCFRLDHVPVQSLSHTLSLSLCHKVIQPVIADADTVCHLTYVEVMLIVVPVREFRLVANRKHFLNSTLGKAAFSCELIEHCHPDDTFARLPRCAQKTQTVRDAVLGDRCIQPRSNRRRRKIHFLVYTRIEHLHVVIFLNKLTNFRKFIGICQNAGMLILRTCGEQLRNLLSTRTDCAGSADQARSSRLCRLCRRRKRRHK